MPALRKQRQADLCKFEASLVYRVSTRIGPKATEKSCLKKPKKLRHKSFRGQIKLISYDPEFGNGFLDMTVKTNKETGKQNLIKFTSLLN